MPDDENARSGFLYLKTAHLSAWLTALPISLPTLSPTTLLPNFAIQIPKSKKSDLTRRYDTIPNKADPSETKNYHYSRMLSSNFVSMLAMASFALTSATAAAVKQPRAAASSKNSNNKVCSNTFYSTPQCCIPTESSLDTPDCITREFRPLLVLLPPNHLHALLRWDRDR